MNHCTRTRYTLIPGSTYRVQFDGEEKQLTFDGRSNRLGVGMLQWHDHAGQPFFNRVDDPDVVVIHSLA